MTGQGLAEQKDAAGARTLFAQFEELYPTNALISEVRLAIARSYETETNWDAAITNYTAWVQAFPHHPKLPQAEFSIAHDHYMAGRETNALMLYTDFITRFPTNPLAARAQFWAGDYYFRQDSFLAAENSYQLVFLNTNWPVSELTFEARMMAGRAAMARPNYKDAIIYFTNLFRPDCPRDLQAQAAFACADATIGQDPTNTSSWNDAIQSLQTIVQTRSNSWEAAQAWGRIGDCYFNMGAKDPAQYLNAITNYTQAINAPSARSAARNEARFQLANITEKQAALKSGNEQTDLLKQALNQYLDAFDQGVQESEGPSLYWIQKAGVAAGQMAESLQRWKVAVKIYGQLKELIPVLGRFCDKKILKANEHLSGPSLTPPSISVPSQSTTNQ